MRFKLTPKLKRLFKSDNTIVSIERVSPSEKEERINNLRLKIKQLDKELFETSQEIIKAQSVRVRSMFDRNKNFIGSIQKQLVESKVINSINWYQKRLKEIVNERKFNQRELDKLTGKFWSKKIRDYLFIAGIFTTFILMIAILFMGLMATLYFLPTILLIVGIYIFIKKLNANR